jgi:hypothetical protein
MAIIVAISKLPCPVSRWISEMGRLGKYTKRHRSTIGAKKIKNYGSLLLACFFRNSR